MAPKLQPKHVLAIQAYDGQPSTCKFFFEGVTNIQNLFQWSDAETIAFLKTKLTGPALDYFIQEPSVREAQTVEIIASKFSNFFKEDSKQTSLQKWSGLKRLSGESLNNLAHRISVLFRKSHPEILDAISQNTIKLNQFLNLIPTEIKIKILENQISDFEEAVSKAQLWHELQTQSQQSVQPSTSANIGLELQVNALQSQVKALIEQNNDLKAKESKQDNNSNRNVNYNNSRNNQGPNRQFTKNQRYQRSSQFQRHPNRNNNYNVRRSFCNICNSRSHSINQCLKLQNLISQQVTRQSSLSNNSNPPNLNPNARSFRSRYNTNSRASNNNNNGNLNA